MVHETTGFLTNVSHEEPGTFVDFMLSVCSDLERSARRAIHQARNDNMRRSAAAVNNDAVDVNIDLAGQLQSDECADNSLFNNEFDLLTDTDSDLLHSQWPVPPFWDWPDVFIGMPTAPERVTRRADGPN